MSNTLAKSIYDTTVAECESIELKVYFEQGFTMIQGKLGDKYSRRYGCGGAFVDDKRVEEKGYNNEYFYKILQEGLVKIIEELNETKDT